VRLWLNQITPDNYDKKSVELRGLMFGDRKCQGEPGFEEQTEEFVPDDGKQLIVVETIFRKAQMEHDYSGFYAKLCTQIVRLELAMKSMKTVLTNLKYSQFRNKLLENCRASFEDLIKMPDLKVENNANEDETDR
jgi:hypothetical protein